MTGLTLSPGVSLRLLDIAEPESNSLKVVVIEMMPHGELELLPQVGGVGRHIVSTPSSRTVELFWDTYVAYFVQNESFERPMADGFGPGLRVTDESALLTFTREWSPSAEMTIGPIQHWCLACLDHIIHVVGTEGPSITISDPRKHG
jgi:hypothetical protein